MRSRYRPAAGLSAAALIAALAAVITPGAASAACHPDAHDLMVTFQPVDNTVADAQYHLSRLTIDNNDPRCALGADGWAMFFNAVRQPAAVLGGAAGDIAREQLADQGLAVARADAAQSGDFYTLAPADGFEPIAPGERRKIDINFELWAVHKSDGPAGWTIRFGGGEPSWVPAKTLLDPADPKQTTAFSGDHRPVETAATRYAANTSPRRTSRCSRASSRSRSRRRSPVGRSRSAAARASPRRARCAARPATCARHCATSRAGTAHRSRCAWTRGWTSTTTASPTPRATRSRRRGTACGSPAPTGPGCCTGSRRCGSSSPPGVPGGGERPPAVHRAGAARGDLRRPLFGYRGLQIDVA